MKNQQMKNLIFEMLSTILSAGRMIFCSHRLIRS